MATDETETGTQGDQQKIAGKREETRRQGPPTPGQAEELVRKPDPAKPDPAAETWPHAKMPGDRGGGPASGTVERKPREVPQKDSGTIQRGGRDGVRGQDDSVRSGDGIAG